MTQARRTLISLDATPYYHCVSRCVRRAFLCGDDPYTHHSYEHRRNWIAERLNQLATIFSIDICAYAIMNNHYHLVLHVDIEQAKSWSDDDVLEHWLSLFTGPLIARRKQRGEVLGPAELDAISKLAKVWRSRLTDIGWFMRCLNENIARQANIEDQCTGRFWEGRYKCQALLDEAALAACLAYVDLNPIRAKMAEIPEQSDFTSVQQRIKALSGCQTDSNALPSQPSELLPFVGNPRQEMPKGLPFRLSDYLELLDWSGRILKMDKRGSIPQGIPPILIRLNINPKHWVYLNTHFESRFKRLVGSAYKIQMACDELGQHWAHGMTACKTLLPD